MFLSFYPLYLDLKSNSAENGLFTLIELLYKCNLNIFLELSRVGEWFKVRKTPFTPAV